MTLRKSRTVRAGMGMVLALGWAWLAVTSALASGPGVIAWRQDLRAALSEAAAQGRPLWIQFTGPWCSYCRRMDRESFTHPRIVARSRDSFIPILLQADAHEDLALRYELSGLPATVILRPTGEVLGKHEGFADAVTFDRFLGSTLARFGPIRSPAPSVSPTVLSTAAGAVRPAAASPAPGNDVALAGYCPVSLVTAHRLVPGRAGLTLTHDGVLYRFATAEGYDAFRKSPERFIPANGGRCPVTQVDRGESCAGNPHWGVLFDGRLYLCADEAERQQFLRDPRRYAQVDVADRGFCPHCWDRDHLLVRGLPQYSFSRGGRRYLFPGPDHLEAFRSATETAHR
ncbi:MAG: thioredoxin family protein [Planctomycetaceae bacterium]|nr:thioredoxin family protein [Planctomycetaceae bacterium]